MDQQKLIVIGTPVQEGTGRPGCNMGPDAFRAAGLIQAFAELGHEVEDRGNLVRRGGEGAHHTNPVLKFLPEFVGWTEAIRDAVMAARDEGVPVVIGGDHSLAAGSLTGNSAHAGQNGRPFFVLWLDAHPDFHTLETTTSGNLHGVPMAYACGLGGFDGALERPAYPVDPKNICMMGIRSVDPAERVALAAHGVTVCDMRMIDEVGVVPLLKRFLDRVKAAGGDLHVSLDVDFLDPTIAPGVGTTVPGGATFREAHLIMEIVSDSGLVTSLDLVELNPFLDERGRTAILMTDLAASLMGKRVMDRPSHTY
ncbi:arginase [Rhizobium sp. C4]|uniref:arginase n=1 Tax=Rhizobium sp. C4 TaxID=1349800 RepID=UPI001E31CBEE|nr:arginase [Rhizobium sp. C4]MCD2176017.1 arginase [Rhizobium sp. C4]